MKFNVTKAYMDTLKRQLKIFEDEGVISKDQRSQMMDAYEVSKGVNLVRLISVVGAVLVGLGILTYIAGNWQDMSPAIRMGLIVLGMTGFYLTGMQLDKSYPKTARALRYIALFIFGGGLFLTDQTFHLNRHVAFHFLIWSVGVFTALYFEKDSLLLYFYQALIGASTIALFDSQGMTGVEFASYFAVVAAGIYLSVRLSDKVYKTQFSGFMTSLNVFFGLLMVLIHFEVDALYGAGAMLVLGLVLLFRAPFAKHAEFVVNQIGLLIAGFSGFILTFSDPWESAFRVDGTLVSVLFTVSMLLGLFYLVKREFIGAIGFIALIIMRYYFDTFYDFMPKSLFFVIGGGILIGFGVYLESVRRKGLSKNA